MRPAHFSELMARGLMFNKKGGGGYYRDLARLCENGDETRIIFSFGGLTVTNRLCDIAPELLVRLERAAAKSYREG